jgi:phosphatidate phosphatase APP1
MPTIPGIVDVAQSNDTPESKHLEMAIKEVYSKKNIELKTDLNDNLIKALTRGKMFYKQYGIKIMNDLVQTVMELRVSKDRKGRQEFTKIVQSMNSYQDMEGKPTLNERLFGGKV